MKRVLLAAFLGAIGMYLWMFVAHMATPLGTMGISEIPKEAPVLSALQSSIGNAPGMYLYPGAAVHGTRAEQQEAMKHYQEKLDANPSGLLIYHPAGLKMNMAPMLILEFVTEFVEAFLACLLLAWATLGTYGRRVAFVTTIGWVAVLATNVPYWNWYGFPATYTVAYMFTQLVGFLVLGLIAGKVLRTV
jgi:hypothetical protein